MSKIADDVLRRFWAKVQKTDSCWEWTASMFPNGYGQFKHRDEMYAHRFSYEAHHGEIPDGAYVLHHCDNRACVRPDHLYSGTHADNMRDMVARGRARSPALKGSANGSARLSEEDVRQIRDRKAKGERARILADEFETTEGNIHQIVSRRNWRHI